MPTENDQKDKNKNEGWGVERAKKRKCKWSPLELKQIFDFKDVLREELKDTIGCLLCEEKSTSTLELNNDKSLKSKSEISLDARLLLSSIPIPKVRGNSS